MWPNGHVDDQVARHWSPSVTLWLEDLDISRFSYCTNSVDSSILRNRVYFGSRDTFSSYTINI